MAYSTQILSTQAKVPGTTSTQAYGESLGTYNLTGTPWQIVPPPPTQTVLDLTKVWV